MVAKARRRKSFERLLQERKCTGYKHRTTREEERSSKMRAEGEREKERERDQSVSSRDTYSVAVVVPLCRNDTSPLSAFRQTLRSSPRRSRRADTLLLTRTQIRRAAPSGNTSVATFHCGPTATTERQKDKQREREREKERTEKEKETRTRTRDVFDSRRFQPVIRARNQRITHWRLDKRRRPSMVIEADPRPRAL